MLKGLNIFLVIKTVNQSFEDFKLFLKVLKVLFYRKSF